MCGELSYNKEFYNVNISRVFHAIEALSVFSCVTFVLFQDVLPLKFIVCAETNIFIWGYTVQIACLVG
jgi:hypothetical protein